MCGRYRLTRVDKLAERFDIEPDDDWAPQYNVAPRRTSPRSSFSGATGYVWAGIWRQLN